MRTIAITLAGLTAFAAAAHAEENGRYQLQPTEGGVVRLDTATGQMSLCATQSGELTCKAAPGQPAAAGGADEMSKRIEALEKRVAELEQGKRVAGLPTDEEFERTMGFMERFFRRFMGVVRDLQQEYGPGGGEAQPGRS